MKHIEITEFGGPDVLQITAGDAPVAGESQVLIRVAAAGINRPDVMQRQGKYPPPPGASVIPGLEIAGEVVETGENVAWPQPGDQVYALVTGGGYAELAVAEAPLCLPIPAGLTSVEAAALPETFFTVWSNLFDRAGLRAGETVLIHGGSSGIGTTAIQLAKAFGATVFTTAGNEEKCKVCRELGADLVINYNEEDFVEACRNATGGKGVEVILDMVAGDYTNRNIAAAAVEGRYVIIAGLRGFSAEVSIRSIMLKRLLITGSTLRPRPVEFKAAIAAGLREQVWPLLESGQVRPVIHTALPLNKANEGHRLMESSRHIGKIMLRVSE
ncbi:MAG: NAD(P)H-quinone oxidoreductase [Gammaproteobacteria bacterium]|nr:NAD(P)H-quinone oxidoreductase [Gammaproteobacteria bacterium]